MKDLLAEDRFQIISDGDKAFILAFDEQIGKLGYDAGGSIGSGYCWGRYMIIYAKTGVKEKRVAARVYIRDEGIVLRLFFSKIDAHRAYIEAAPAHIRDVFTGSHGGCNHCKDMGGGTCKFRKSYTLEGRLIEKCSGVVFEFWKPDLLKLPDYIGLLSEFYPVTSLSRRPARRPR